MHPAACRARLALQRQDLKQGAANAMKAVAQVLRTSTLSVYESCAINNIIYRGDRAAAAADY